MGQATTAAGAIFFCAMTYGEQAAVESARTELGAFLGPAAREITPFPFAFTDYYKEEMGGSLVKTIRLFANPADPSILADIKLKTNALEARFSVQPGGRKINLDPGYLTLAKVVLATTKDFSHRIYLRDGIYAEVTLSARNGAFQPHPWTYPDYKQESVRQFFWEARELLAASRTVRRED